MAVDNRQQSQMSGMGYDPLRYPQPHFTNPWAAASGPSTSHQLYSTSAVAPAPSGLENHAVSQPQPVQRPTSIALPYHGLSVTAPPMASGIVLQDGSLFSENLLDASQDLLSRSYNGGYVSSAASASQTTYAPTSAPYSQLEYGNNARNPYAFPQDTTRRSSHPLVPSPPLYDDAIDPQRQRQNSLVDFSRMNAPQPQRNSFSDALDASRGMVSLSQADITPRNIYGGGSRSSTDSYGFPSTHSAHSSISSASYNASYYGGEGSVTDYSSASESVDLNRTLPRPNALIGANIPPAPQSMMGQFSSKVSSSSQKKHKCKICDKRFTRPSSLQTHMYSHTGEKRTLDLP